MGFIFLSIEVQIFVMGLFDEKIHTVSVCKGF